MYSLGTYLSDADVMAEAKNGRGPTPKTAAVVRRAARGDVVSTSYGVLVLQTRKYESYYAMKRANARVHIFPFDH